MPTEDQEVMEQEEEGKAFTLLCRSDTCKGRQGNREGCGGRCPTLCGPMTRAHQVPLSMEFSRQEYKNGLPFPAPGDLPDPAIKPTSLASLALAGGSFRSPGIIAFFYSKGG